MDKEVKNNLVLEQDCCFEWNMPKTKYHCVLKSYLGQRAIFLRKAKADGLPEQAINSRAKQYPDYDESYSDADKQVALSKYVELVFVFHNDEKVSPRRWNTDKFKAFYTGKCPDTAKEERLFHAKEDQILPNDFVIIEMSVQGRFYDTRKQLSYEALNQGRDQEAYRPTQEIALKVNKEKFDGLAAYSARYNEGSCCVIFNDNCIKAPREHQVFSE